MKWFKLTILSLLFVLIAIAFLLETPLGKQMAQKVLLQALKRSGISLNVGQIGGQFPNNIEISDLKYQNISIEKLQFDLSLLALLGGEIKIQELTAQHVQIQKSIAPQAGAKKISSPMAVTVRRYHLSDVQFEDFPSFDAKGSFSMRRKTSSWHTQGKLVRKEVPEAFLAFEVVRNRLGKMEADFDLSSKTLDFFSPLTPVSSVDGSISAQAHFRGTPTEFTGHVNGKLCVTTGDEWIKRKWVFKSRLRKEKESPLQLQKTLISTQGLSIRGQGFLNSSYALESATFHTRLFLDAFNLPWQSHGLVLADGSLQKMNEGYAIQAKFRSDPLQVYNTSLQITDGSIKGIWKEMAFQGTIDLGAASHQTNWTLHSDLFFKKPRLELQNLAVHSDLLGLEGNISFANCIWQGELALQHAHLSLLDKSLLGIGDGTITLSEKEAKAQVQIDAIIRNPAYEDLSASSVHIVSDGASLYADFERIKWKKIILDGAQLNIANNDWNGSIEAKNIQLTGAGTLDWQTSLSIQSITGNIGEYSVFLLEPSKVSWTPSSFSWKKLYAGIGNGTLEASYVQEKNEIAAYCRCLQIPLEPFLDAIGAFDAYATLQKKEDAIDIDWDWTLQKATLKTPPLHHCFIEEKKPLSFSAKMQGSLHRNELALKAHLQDENSPLFDIDLKMPLHLDAHFKPSFDIGPFRAAIKADGDLADLFEAFNFGMHQMSGKVHCDLSVSNNRVKGICTLQNGYYQNYVTGTELTDISAIFEGSGDRLILSSFTAHDLQDKPVLFAKGFIEASPFEGFPFHFDATLDQLPLVQIDLVTAFGDGNLSIDGNLQSTLASGNIQITQADIAIPTHIPRSYPDLQVIYKHKPIPSTLPSASNPPYPLRLDLAIQGSEAIFISGRGLTSEWKGDFAIGGTFKQPEFLGNLTLIEGEFAFAGRRFKLQNGSVSMPGAHYQLPLIDITGATVEKDISITVRLKGPLNRPQLTFQSLPPLPLSAILSYLLFGKDLSDVTGLQALQLAGTIAAVAGEGPDILEMTRKSLGVDRLQIVMTPAKSGEGYDGKETVALQIGKVLTPGLIVTIKQSADDSNPDLGIEIDLTHGFTFEAENQQQPEQGKFSLKWNVNY